MNENTENIGDREQTNTEHPRAGTRQQHTGSRGPQDGGFATQAVEGVGGGLVTMIDATENVLEEIVRAAGRLGTTTIEEIFTVLGSVVGGAGAIFQGNRNVGRREHVSGRRDERRTDNSDVRSGGF